MSVPQMFLTQLGWTVLHLSWIGCGVGVLMYALNACIPARSSSPRYKANFVGLLALAAGVPLTFVITGTPALLAQTDQIESPEVAASNSPGTLERDTDGAIGRFTSRPQQGIQLAAGQTYEHPPMTLAEPQYISGQLIDAAGRPVGSAWINSARGRNYYTKTKANGEFKLRVPGYWLRYTQDKDMVSRAALRITTEAQRGVIAHVEDRDPYVLRIDNDEPLLGKQKPTQRAMAAAVDAQRFVNEPLTKILKTLARSLAVEFRFDDEAFKSIGRDPTQIRITTNLESMTLQRALAKILPLASAGWTEGTASLQRGMSFVSGRPVRTADITIVPLK